MFKTKQPSSQNSWGLQCVLMGTENSPRLICIPTLGFNKAELSRAAQGLFCPISKMKSSQIPVEHPHCCRWVLNSQHSWIQAEQVKWKMRP